MSTPTPALVTHRGAVALPRLALLLFCAAYVVPGLLGRDPWRNAELTAYGVMSAMAEARTSWLTPTLGGVPVDTALLPHWLGALSISLLGPWVGAPLAGRLPFALLLVATLALTWYAAFHLARTEAAQPVAFAFGGEADPVDYARAIADGALLALIATLGLLQLGHETTPELAQLAAVAGVLWALAAAPYRPRATRAALLMSLPLLSACGAPAIAVAVGATGTLVCARSGYAQVQRLAGWVAAATVLGGLVAWATGNWRWRIASGLQADDLWTIARQWAWFLWPVWPAAIWTLWRWRRHLQHRHVSVPLTVVLAALLANVLMGGSDRALMLALPAMAILAAFALPTLRRSASAAIDWFSMCLFTAAALTIWVIYVAMQTGVPAQPAANVARLAPLFNPAFSAADLCAALLATLAWLWLLRWRTGRHREAVWKSMVLPAGGVALSWLLLMSLWRPLLDHARSAEPWVAALRPHVHSPRCIAAPGLAAPLVAALEVHGHWRVMADPLAAAQADCPLRLSLVSNGVASVSPPGPGWQAEATVARPTDRDELTTVWRRLAP